MIDKISRITLYVDNQQQAKKFWVNQIGFELKFEKDMGQQITWLEVGPKNHDTTFVLYDKELMKKMNSTTCVDHSSIILSCEDIEKEHQRMKDNNIKVNDIQVMPYGKIFVFYDQDGNDYLLREE
ncbi:MAG: VOC family protein [Coprobacillus sp.]